MNTIKEMLQQAGFSEIVFENSTIFQPASDDDNTLMVEFRDKSHLNEYIQSMIEHGHTSDATIKTDDGWLIVYYCDNRHDALLDKLTLSTNVHKKPFMHRRSTEHHWGSFL